MKLFMFLMMVSTSAFSIGYNEYGEIVTNGYLNGFEDNNTTVIDGVTYVTPSKVRGYEPPKVIVMPPIGGYIYPPIFQPHQSYNRW